MFLKIGKVWDIFPPKLPSYTYISMPESHELTSAVADILPRVLRGSECLSGEVELH